MEIDNFAPEAPRPRPRTLTVLVLLAGVALIFSYLIAYAMTGALASAEVIAPWASDQDPRPRWFAKTFCGLTASFVLFAALLRLASWRQLRSIDQMDDTTGEA